MDGLLSPRPSQWASQLKSFVRLKKKEETKKGFATSGWCKCAAVSRKFFSSVRNTKRLCVKKITRALSIVSSRLWKLEIQFIRIENRRCMNRPKKRVKYVFIIFFYLYARVLHFESTSNTKFLEKVSFFKKKWICRENICIINSSLIVVILTVIIFILFLHT